jgi:hypothetical protein
MGPDPHKQGGEDFADPSPADDQDGTVLQGHRERCCHEMERAVGSDTGVFFQISFFFQKVKFPSLDSINTTKLVKTYLGNGQIEKISVNLSSRINQVTLKYDTEQ